MPPNVLEAPRKARKRKAVHPSSQGTNTRQRASRVPLGVPWAVDTETTGLDLWHGCRPFFVSACSEEGEIRFWEWDVDPMTRQPLPPKKDLGEVRKLVTSNHLVLHNTKFDARALEFIGVDDFPWDAFDDTLVASHVLASAESHKLKDLGLLYLDVDDEDQLELKEAVNEARRYGRKNGWRIANPEDPHFPAMKRSPKDGWFMMDCWLPRAVAKAEDYPEDHWFWNVLQRYAVTDAERTIGLWLVFRQAMEEEGVLDIYEKRKKLLPITYNMERRGVTVNVKRLDDARMKYGLEAERSEGLCYQLANNKLDNVRSSKQLQGVIFGTLGFKPVKETKTGWSTDADTIRALMLEAEPKEKRYQFLKHLQGTRKFSKAVDYLQSYELHGIPIGTDGAWLRLHPGFNPTGTATTRLASHDPNAQNISKQEDFNLREVFGPLPGREWFAIDYSNIELRIFAYESGDKALIQAFEQGQSVHLVIGEILHPKLFNKLGPDAFKKTQQYRWVKNGNFSLIYGASQKKANATYRVQDAYQRIRKRLPKIDGFIRSKFDEGKTNGFVRTLGGYPLQVPPREPHKAANYFVQGSAGWAMVLAMIRVDEYLATLGDDFGIVMTIHDELVLDFPQRKGNIPKVRKVCRLMEQSGDDLGLPCPVEPDVIRTNWADGKGLVLTA